MFQLLIASGFLFMGATEEQMALLSSKHVTHVSYILLIFSVSFLLFLCKSFPTVILPALFSDPLQSSICSSTSMPSTPSQSPHSASRETPCGPTERPTRRRPSRRPTRTATQTDTPNTPSRFQSVSADACGTRRSLSSILSSVTRTRSSRSRRAQPVEVSDCKNALRVLC